MKNKLDYWYFLGKQIASDRIITQSIIEKVEDKRKFLFFPNKTKKDFEITDIRNFFPLTNNLFGIIIKSSLDKDSLEFLTSSFGEVSEYKNYYLIKLVSDRDYKIFADEFLFPENVSCLAKFRDRPRSLDDKEISSLLVSMLAFCDDGDCLMLQSHEDNPNS